MNRAYRIREIDNEHSFDFNDLLNNMPTEVIEQLNSEGVGMIEIEVRDLIKANMKIKSEKLATDISEAVMNGDFTIKYLVM